MVKTILKKATVIVLLCMAVLLAACGKEETKSSRKRDKSTKSTVSTDTSASGSLSSSSKSDTQDAKGGVKVIVTFQKEDGKTVEEERSFSEDMDFLTTEGPVWTLDLCGNEITLSKNLTVSTEGTIMNGTLVTSENALLVNRGDLCLGGNDSGNVLSFKVDSRGIVNYGKLYLKRIDFHLYNGTGITNEGELLNGRESFDKSMSEYSADSGLLLYNKGTATLYMVSVSGKSDLFIKNAEALNICRADFDAEGGVFIQNEKEKNLALYDCMFKIDSDSEVGVRNFGSTEKKSGGLTARNEVSACFDVSAGTGIENYGEWHARGKVNLTGGIGIHNFSGEEITEEYEWIFVDEENGTALLNEGIFGFIQVNLTKGTAVVNKGTLSGDVRISTVSENYEGVLVSNDHSGALSANLYINTASLNNATLIDNYGSMHGKLKHTDCVLKTHTGLKITNLKDWFNTTKLSTVMYDIVLTETCKDSCQLLNRGKIEDYELDLQLFGKGENYFGIRTEAGTKAQFSGEARFVTCGSGITALEISRSSILNFEFATFLSDTTGVFALEGISFNKESVNRDDMNNNVLILNGGTLGLVKDQSRLYVEVSGKSTTGIDNSGFIEGYEVAVVVAGNDNKGLINTGSVTSDMLDVKIKERGGNTGCINTNIINSSRLNAASAKNEEGEALIANTDIAFLNKPEGKVTCENYAHIYAGATGVTAFDNYGNLKCNKFEVEFERGNGFINQAGSIISAAKLTVDSRKDDGDGTGIVTYDLMDITGPISMIVKGPGNYGILIMSGGSLSQTFDGEFVGAELTSEAGGHVAYNEGRLYLERPYFTKPTSGVWEDVLSNHGNFNYSWLRPKSFYDEGGELIGPWKGIGYSDYSE